MKPRKNPAKKLQDPRYRRRRELFLRRLSSKLPPYENTNALGILRLRETIGSFRGKRILEIGTALEKPVLDVLREMGAEAEEFAGGRLLQRPESRLPEKKYDAVLANRVFEIDGFEVETPDGRSFSWQMFLTMKPAEAERQLEVVLKKIFDSLKPGGIFLVNNLSTSKNVPFTREQLRKTGFGILQFDVNERAMNWVTILQRPT